MVANQVVPWNAGATEARSIAQLAGRATATVIAAAQRPESSATVQASKVIPASQSAIGPACQASRWKGNQLAAQSNQSVV